MIMSEQMNIYQKLAKIRKPVEVIKKNRKGYGYTYVDEEEILSKITGLMGKYSVSLVPNITHGSAKVEPYHYVKTKTTKDGKTYEEHVNEVMVRADMDWIWVNDENPADRVVVPWFFCWLTVGCQSGFRLGAHLRLQVFSLKVLQRCHIRRRSGQLEEPPEGGGERGGPPDRRQNRRADPFSCDYIFER